MDVWQGSEFASNHDTVTFKIYFFLKNRKNENISYESTQSVSLTKDLIICKYPFWRIPSKTQEMLNKVFYVRYTLALTFSMYDKTVKDIY